MKTTIVLALTLTAGSAFAQTPAPKPAAPTAAVEPRFASWLGCWRLDDDLAGTGARMCITPDKSGVRLQTIIGTQKGIDEVVIPDGVARPIVDSECKGTERAEWSQDGARVFRITDVTCGKEAPRIIKSVAFMAPGPSWITVQHVSGTAANTSVRVQRYRRAVNQQLADGSRAQQPESALTSRTEPSKTTWDIDDVIEASLNLPVEAMQAVLTEVHHPFELNRKTLVALDDAGVSEPVIDLMVALTYPQHFVVERKGGSMPTGLSTGTGWYDPFMSPMLMGGMADCYSPMGYGYRSYYSMCGAGLYGYNQFYGYNSSYYGNYYPYGGWVNVGNLPSVGGNPIEIQPEGRAVNGRGYTQIRNREAEPSSPRVNGGNNGGGYAGTGSAGATSGGYSSGSSSSGSSGGSSGGDSGARVAVPKGGGH